MADTSPATLIARRVEQPLISVIIPAYNEASTLLHTLSNTVQHLQQWCTRWQILVIDDGSRDHTAQIVKSVDPAWRCGLLRLSRNFGKEYAISAGLEYARGDVVVCMDADGQHSAALVEQMLQHWQAGYDMVYAVRQDRQQESKFKQWGSRLFYRTISMGGQIDIPRDAGDFRLMDRKVVNALLSLPERNRFMKGMYAWVGFNSIGIPYTPLPRFHGESSFSKLKLIQLAWTGFTSFSHAPLRLSSMVGIALALLAIIYGIVVVIDKLFFNESVPGWPTVVAGMMFLSGVQLLFIGILGEYLARVYDEVKGRPPYIIAEVYQPECDQA